MRKLTLAAGAVVAVLLVLGWASGTFDWIARHAVAAQREFQTALAGSVRSLKAGERGALWGLVSLCFAYGIVHAAGPGHGKMLVGGYAVAQRIPARRIVAISLAASLAQALAAVVLVYLGVGVFSWTMTTMVGLAERSLSVLSLVIIGGIGLYLGWRGWKMLAGPAHGAVTAPHQGDHVHDAACCHHAHGPNLDEIGRAYRLRDALALVAGVAVRPCTGAILLLILCWRIGADAAGIAGTFAMGLGTAVVTVTAALMAATMREGAWASGLDTRAMQRVMGGLGVLAGVALFGTSVAMLRP